MKKLSVHLLVINIFSIFCKFPLFTVQLSGGGSEGCGHEEGGVSLTLV
jgi:hypothetical protein